MTDFTPEAEPLCSFCDIELDPRYDYRCILCARPACDRCSQACQAEDCDYITCSRCVKRHLQMRHPGYGHEFSEDRTNPVSDLKSALERGSIIYEQ